MKTLKQQTEKINSDTGQIQAIGKEIKSILTWDMFIKDDLNYSTKINDEMFLDECQKQYDFETNHKRS